MIFFGWFSQRRPVYDDADRMLARIRRFASTRTSPEWSQTLHQGPGWGVYVAAPRAGGWHWDLLADTDGITVVSTAPPVGLPPTAVSAGPVALGRAVLRGAPIPGDIVPPFGMIVIDPAAHQFAVRQDWLGMARLYEYSSQGVVVYSSSPVMPPYVLGDRLVPDEDGWARYLGAGFFSGSTTPVRGVRVLPPGAVRTGRRRRDGTWELTSSTGRGIDDLLAEPAPPTDASVKETAAGLRRVGTSLGALWSGDVRLGLSGGKDSRLVTAVLLAAGKVPTLFTLDDNPAETSTAAHLVELARRTRGVDLRHDIVQPATKQRTHATSLAERTRRLLLRYDFGYGSSYLLRPMVGLARPGSVAAPVVGGAMGEIATSRWIPPGWPDQSEQVDGDALRVALRTVLGSEVQPAWQTPDTRRRIEVAIEEVVERGERIGLDAVGTVHLAFLTERMRSWSTAAYHVNQVTPLLTPEFVQASFAMSLDQKRQRAIHEGVIDALVPEWTGIPFVHNTSGLQPAQIPRIWDGDGVDVLHAAVTRPPGPLIDLVDRAAVVSAVERARQGVGTHQDDTALRNTVILAAAEDLFAELNAEVRSFVQSPVVVERTRYQRLRRRAAQALPQPVLSALPRARRRRRAPR